MADLNPIDNIKTYRTVADQAYGKKPPLRVELALKKAGAGSTLDDPTPLPDAPAASIPGVKFTKGFTPAEKAKQQAMLAAKLRLRDAADSKADAASKAANQEGDE